MRRVVARLARVPALALGVLLASGVPAAAGDGAGDIARAPDPGAVLAQLVQDVGGRGASHHPQRYHYLHKLDGHLQDIAASRLGTGSEATAAIAAERQGVTTSPAGDVGVDIYVHGDAARAAGALRALGMRVTAVSDAAPQRMVEGFLPAAALADAAALPATKAILAPFSRLSVGSVTSQGDAAIFGPQARLLGPKGAGVSVGVISDSIDQVGGGIAGSQASGDLPPVVEIQGSDLPGGSDEGRAMAEIVYDEAPELSRIVFATAAGGPAAKANAIDGLVSRGVKIITDDTSYITEPFFQDDVVAQAVDRAKANGVAYFISAGNDGKQSWEGAYSGGATQDFNPPAGDAVQTVGTLPAHASASLVLQWAEPWGGAVTDFALDVYRLSGATWVALGTVNSNNLVSGIPMEATGITAGGSSLTYGIGIRRVGGASNPLLKYIAFTNGAGSVNIERGANSGAISPDGASASGALTVAASRYNTPTTPETFSSRGPAIRRFDAAGTPLAAPDVRQKPNLAGPDGVATSVSGFSQFYGTSAASPAAAGIAALILSAKPAMSVDQLYAIMTNPANALDCPAAGNPDSDCGVGFVLANRALAMALDGTPPVITAAVSPALPDGANGWYRGPVSVAWSVSDAESPVTKPAGCDPVSLGDGIAPLTCSATSAGGSASLPVTIMRDSTAPSAPVISGITARKYVRTALPEASSIACSAADPTSGVPSCKVTGYDRRPGSHRLTATATNGAGLTATTTLTYAVSKPATISKLTLAQGITLTKLVRSGLPVTVRVATGQTRLVATLATRLPKDVGTGTRSVVLGVLSKRVPTGTARLRITLTAKAKARLRGVTEATLKVTIAGRSPGATDKLLQRSLVARRP